MCAVEARRGCGYRKVGGLYVVSEGLGEPCERLPIPIVPCGRCGQKIEFSRSFQWIKLEYLVQNAPGCRDDKGHCPRCPLCYPDLFGQFAQPGDRAGLLWIKLEYLVQNAPGCRDDTSHCPRCPLCYPDLFGQFAQPGDRAGLLWIGEQYYKTGAEFVREAERLGVSRRLAAVPKDLVLGRTYIFVAHNKAILRACDHCQGSGQMKDGKCLQCRGAGQLGSPGVFHGFRAQRLELIVTPSLRNQDWVQDLVKKGVTLVEVPEGDLDHVPTKRTKKTRRQQAIEKRALTTDDVERAKQKEAQAELPGFDN